MKLKPIRHISSALAVTVAAALSACGGGDALPPGATVLTPAPDKTPPTITIASSSAGATATGAVTFTFTFSENVGTSFTADDVVVTGGAKGAFTTPNGTSATLVVTPNASSTGTLELSVAAAKYSDLAGNLNTAAVAISQAYNNVAPTGSGKTGTCTAAPCNDFSAAGMAAVSFGGLAADVVNDPGDATNKVLRLVKNPAAETWAGTTIDPSGTGVATVPAIGFATSKVVSLRVLSMAAGQTIMLKVENAADPAVNMEATALTTKVNQWETLSFNYAAPTAGTYDASKTYNRVSVFPSFGSKVTATMTFHVDELNYAAVVTTPPATSSTNLVSFDAAGTTYTLTGFGGAEDATVVNDPSGGTNKVAKIVKSATAELWAGTTMSTGANQSIATIAFTASAKTMTMRVYSPAAGVPIRLKVENAADPTKSVETEATTTVANAWQTLTFDFANQAAGTAALNLATTYNKASVFPNFGKTGAQGGGGTWHFDDLSFVSASTTPPVTGTSLVNFDAAGTTYTLTGFGGAEDATVVNDPAGGTNKVAKIVKSATAELWAGTTISTGANMSITTVPFTATDKTVTLRVFSTAAGIPIRLKLENAADPTKSVETEATTTTANAWQTLSFNFANQVAGTAALNLATTYNKVSVFPNFGKTGAQGGGGTWHFDDLSFAGAGTTPPAATGTSLVTFDAAGTTYTLSGFGGAEDATVVNDPIGGTNKVAKIVKSATAELWAGTTMSTGANFSITKVPFTASAKTLTMRVYSTAAGIPIRLKVENAADPTQSVETEATTTTANAWQTLSFNFANQAAGTAALNLAFTYNKASVFPNFGKTGAQGGGGTWHFDDLLFTP